jgi:hypothetical protein
VASRRFTLRALFAVLALAGGAAVHLPAAAQPTAADKETARSLMDQGDKAFEAKDFNAALKHYSAAHSIMKVPTTGIEVARTQAALGQLIEARELALEIGRGTSQPNEPRAFAKARTEAKNLADSLSPRIPSVQVKVSGVPEGAPVRVVVDGTELPAEAASSPRKVNPGAHTVAVSSPGYSEVTGNVEVKETESKIVEVTLKAAGAAADGASAVSSSGTPGSDQGTSSGEGGGLPALAYVGFGVGAAGLIAGSVTGVLSLSKASSAKDQCEDNRCPPAAQDDIDSSKSLGTISNIGFIVGGVGIGVGVYALLTGGGDEPATGRRPRVRPRVGLGFVGIDGRF